MNGIDFQLLARIQSVIDYAEKTGDINTQIVLNTLYGAVQQGHTFALASNIQQFTKNVLLPQLEAAELNRRANLN